MRTINKIILHCTATIEGKDYRAKDIDRWHKARGWKGIGYHYVIDLDGTVEKGRKDSEIGAHCSGQNAHSIGVVYVGGLATDGKTAKDTRTKEQKAALITLVKKLLKQYNLTINNVYCHNQFANKACPSFSINTFKREVGRS